MANSASEDLPRPNDPGFSTIKERRPIEVYSRFGDVERFLEGYLLHKAPTLPESMRQFLVRAAPWLVLISLVLCLPVVLLLLGLGTVLLPLTVFSPAPFHSATSLVMHGVITVGVMMLYGLALGGLFRRTRRAWSYVFYALLLAAVGNVLAVSVGALLLGTLLPLYLLFQTKYLYTE